MPRHPHAAARRSSLLTLLSAVAGSALVLTAVLLPSSPADASGAGPRTSDAHGVVLPNGRIVTPAGSRYDRDRRPGDASYDLGDFPVGMALSPDGRLAVVSLNGRGYGTPHTNGTFCDQHSGTHPVECPGVPDRLKGDPRVTAPDEGLDVVDLTTGKVVQVVAVPTSNAPSGHQACGQGFNSVVPRTSGTLGSSPDAVAFSRDGRTAYVALAGDDAVAVVDVAARAVRGYVPSGWYPTAVAVGPRDGRLLTLAAKGLGSRYVAVAGGYLPPAGTSLPTGAAVPTGAYYDAENMPGLLTRVTPPDRARLAAYTRTAAADVTRAAQLDRRPAHSPVPAAVGGVSPISHVVYVVRENRTFDQVFGDLALRRRDVSADPAMQLLAAATPNAHAVAGRYAISDSFFSDGEASIQGHWWTSSAASNDYVEKSWRQYYSPRGRPADSAVLPVTSAPGCSIFQRLQAFQLTHPTFTFRNYGELVGLVEPTTSVGQPQANLCGGAGPGGPGSNTFSDPSYPSETDLTPDDRTRTAEFLKDSGLTLEGKDAGNGSSLRSFSYLIMSEDHTTGLGGVQTPRSQVAQNDAAVGQLISALSRSKYWSSTAVVVTEDDSQDGVDHVDGHRNVLLLASPYAKQRSADGCLPGYVGHARVDQASVLRTVELLLGVPPISAYDAGATPLYDLFQDKDSATELTPSDLAPFQVAPPPPFIDETVASLPRTTRNASLLAWSKTLDTTHLDRDEAALEAVLWESVRDDPLPHELAAKLAGARAEQEALAPVTGLVSSAARSTATGDPLVRGQSVRCAQPVRLSAAVLPGQTTVGGAGDGVLAATGLAQRGGLLGAGLLLLALAALRRRTAAGLHRASTA